MENRYLFRGKQTDNGEWIIGSLIIDKQQDIETGEQIEIIGIYPSEYKDFSKRIDPSTVCQCTGLKDKNGKLIWENDIVRCVYDCNEKTYIVIWDDSEVDFKATNGKENYGGNFQYLTCCEEIEILGNIFDNPKLLEGNHDGE